MCLFFLFEFPCQIVLSFFLWWYSYLPLTEALSWDYPLQCPNFFFLNENPIQWNYLLYYWLYGLVLQIFGSPSLLSALLKLFEFLLNFFFTLLTYQNLFSGRSCVVSFYSSCGLHARTIYLLSAQPPKSIQQLILCWYWS